MEPQRNRKAAKQARSACHSNSVALQTCISTLYIVVTNI